MKVKDKANPRDATPEKQPAEMFKKGQIYPDLNLMYDRVDDFNNYVKSEYKKIILEAQDLVKSGAKEIILLGQNVNAYSYYEDKKELRISDLINELDKINELKRRRQSCFHGCFKV